MAKSIEYNKGDKLGYLVFLKYTREVSPKRALFICECGNTIEARIDKAKIGRPISCGCKTLSLTTHKKHNLCNHKLYRVFDSMKQRCYNKNTKAYKNYGGRNITICNEWNNDFMSFYNWAICNGYKDGLSIDRINNNDGYSPSNCRWVTKDIQQQNTRKLCSHNTSGFRGVSKQKDKWVAQITHKNKNIYIGTYENKEDASIAYDNWVINHNTNHTTNTWG